ncbi:hypothetical protein GB928_008520, partial [Shinella curvata]
FASNPATKPRPNQVASVLGSVIAVGENDGVAALLPLLPKSAEGAAAVFAVAERNANAGDTGTAGILVAQGLSLDPQNADGRLLEEEIRYRSGLDSRDASLGDVLREATTRRLQKYSLAAANSDRGAAGAALALFELECRSERLGRSVAANAFKYLFQTLPSDTSPLGPALEALRRNPNLKLTLTYAVLALVEQEREGEALDLIRIAIEREFEIISQDAYSAESGLKRVLLYLSLLSPCLDEAFRRAALTDAPELLRKILPLMRDVRAAAFDLYPVQVRSLFKAAVGIAMKCGDEELIHDMLDETARLSPEDAALQSYVLQGASGSPKFLLKNTGRLKELYVRVDQSVQDRLAAQEVAAAEGEALDLSKEPQELLLPEGNESDTGDFSYGANERDEENRIIRELLNGLPTSERRDYIVEKIDGFPELDKERAIFSIKAGLVFGEYRLVETGLRFFEDDVSPTIDVLRLRYQYARRLGDLSLSVAIIEEIMDRVFKRAHDLQSSNIASLLSIREELEEVLFVQKYEQICAETTIDAQNLAGVVFTFAVSRWRLRNLPLFAFAQLRKRNVAIVSLIDGVMPSDRTGRPEIDQFAGAFTKFKRFYRRWNKGEGQGLEKWDLRPEQGIMSYEGLNVFQGFVETLQTQDRRNTFDFSNPSVLRRMERYINHASHLIRGLEDMEDVFRRVDVPIRFIVTDGHVATMPIFRQFCLLKNIKNVEAVYINNSYENYYSNLSTFVSTSLSVKNITATPTLRAPFLAVESEFLAWLDSNQHRKEEWKSLADKAMTHDRVRRQTDDVERDSVLTRVEAAREAGIHVIGLLGKVPADLAVPVDGGPAHKDIRDWLNHTVSVVGSDPRTMLLIKPHPHERRGEIGRFVTEEFADMIQGPLPSNVIILGHQWFNLKDMKELIDLGLLWNGTACMEFGMLGIPALAGGWFAPIDYPVGIRTPIDREEYEFLLRTPGAVALEPDVGLRCQALMAYMASEEMSIPHRYTARPATNIGLKRYFQWFDEDVENWRKFGDPSIERICDRIMEEKPREPLPEFMKKGWLV